ncbi:MAG: response regulator [Cyanobacteria bacterium P01_F01_bin.150]
MLKNSALDLLKVDKCRSTGLNERLQTLYPNRYEEVALKLEQLVYSHQQAQAHRHQVALKDITNQLLWWLGYIVDIYPAHGKIFIVDDTIETIKLVTTLLTQYGYKTDSAFNGKLALAKILSVNPNLIILDINLPDMNGYQVYNTLQKCSETANIPVIFLSGMSHMKRISSSNQRRVGYLEKPFKPDALIKYVNDYIDVPSSSEIPTDDRSLAEIKVRQKHAQKLSFLLDKYISNSKESKHDGKHLDSHFFFRATFDGRYLKISQAFAKLYGYESTETMLASVTNLWQQCYMEVGNQKQWSICLQYPNQIQTWPARIRTKQNQILDVVEHIALVQDSYKRNLFYQGYLCLA